MDYSLYFLAHHGILGQRWGIRRYQNPDGSLTERGRRRLEKQDAKWARKNYNKAYKSSYKQIRKPLAEADKEIRSQVKLRNADGSLSRSYINAFNRRFADLMNQSESSLVAPSGRVIRWVAKRGDLGVQMALASTDYDMSQVRSGIWEGGRVGYSKRKIKTI